MCRKEDRTGDGRASDKGKEGKERRKREFSAHTERYHADAFMHACIMLVFR